ncbi:MAG: hypothetical protein Q8L86_05445 [Vicinamibacterales bacterium]|nr:hypothetical protein [Vicinamibacterales bacterium]
MRHLLLLAVLTGLPTAAAAQPPAPPAPAIDPAALGISLDRIERKLEGKSQISAGSPFGGDLKLDFFVGVVAEAPPIDFFADFNVHAGPVPGSAPSHREVIDHLTPEAFRSPTPNLLGMAAWLGVQAYKKLQQERWERVYERYRQRIEAGEDIPAPRPPGQQ